MIRLENIRYRSILSNIDLHLEKGKIVMLLGENGCGKTTLIKCLLQLIPYDGKVYFQDRLINDLDKRSLAEIFSYVPQIKTLVDHISVLEFVVAGRTRFLPSYQTPSNKDYDIALNALKEFGLEHLKDRSMFEISGGELQLCYVARSIVQEANILVMDEPCTFLDYEKQYRFMERIKTLRSDDKMILISIHDPNLAIRYADEIVFMKNGKIFDTLEKKDSEFIERFCEIYNQLFSNHFAYDKNSNFIYWKFEDR